MLKRALIFADFVFDQQLGLEGHILDLVYAFAALAHFWSILSLVRSIFLLVMKVSAPLILLVFRQHLLF